MPDRRPDAKEIRSELERLISSPAFVKSPQLVRFLKFVVEETLAGRGDRIKAYTIATDALGRDASFDPQNDPIVRVEAGRLRHTLNQYYACEGRNNPVTIEMPRGNYMPLFSVNTPQRRAIGQIYRLRRRAADLVRENYRLVLMMVIVAIIVSLLLDLLGIAITKSIWPGADRAKNDGSPAVSSPDATGGLKR